MKTSHIVSRKNGTIEGGAARLSTLSASITVGAANAGNVNIHIIRQNIDSTGLREAAKLFKKLADVLDAKN